MKLALVASVSMLISSAFAQSLKGNGSSGGGNGVVCYKNNQIESVQLLDLYEGSVLYNRVYDSLENETLEKSLQLAAQKLYSYDADMVSDAYLDYLDTFKKFHMLAPGVRLKPIEDSGHIIIPGNCKIEQVANFYNNKTIFIVSDFYNKMDNLSKAALVVHEKIWEIDRKENVPTSQYSRRVVSAIFDSAFVFDDPKTTINKKGTMCWTPYGDPFEIGYNFNPGLKRSTSFLVERKDEQTILHFAQINGHKIYSSKTFTTNENINLNWLEKGSVEYEGEYLIGWNLESNFDDNEKLVISTSQKNAKDILRKPIKGHRVNFLKMSWIGSDPDDSFKDLNFLCAEVEVGEKLNKFFKKKTR